VTVAGGASGSREALEGAIDALRAVGVDEPRLDAEVLLAEATGLGRAALVAGADVEPAAGRLFGEMVRRRLRREPVAYIIGRKGFRGIELSVDSQVLIPRPETELLVEVALERRPTTLLDVGTGSGAIALAVASELPACEVTATDTSPSALGVARANAERLRLGDRVRFLPGSLPPEEDFELVLANLPYVAESEWPSLQPEVTRWEPRQALLSGPDGLDAIRELIAAFAAHSSRYAGGVVTAVALEIGAGQADAVEALMRGAGFVAIERRRDLAGIERVVIGEL
jgi:release factor glutamine methyltransferase